jgi:hypothetical protein
VQCSKNQALLEKNKYYKEKKMLTKFFKKILGIPPARPAEPVVDSVKPAPEVAPTAAVEVKPAPVIAPEVEAVPVQVTINPVEEPVVPPKKKPAKKSSAKTPSTSTAVVKKSRAKKPAKTQ